MAGLLTSVLFNFLLDDLDRRFIKDFPELPYVRYIHEVFVALPLNSKEKVSFEKTKELLADLGLSAKEIFIIKGGAPVPCYGGILSVGQDGLIQFLPK